MIDFPIEILGVLYNVQEEEYKGMNEGNLGLCDTTNCEITIRSGLTPDRGFETFIHELTHAWDNYNHIKRYNISYENTPTGEVYIDMTKSMDEGELIGKILYFVNPIEINAWTASFAGYLHEYVESNTINSPHEALKIIKSSPLYQNYINMGEYIDAIYNGTEVFANEKDCNRK